MREIEEGGQDTSASLYTGRRTDRILKARDGREVPIVLQQRKQELMHDFVDVDGISYDIPIEDENISTEHFNILTQVQISSSLVPLAVATLTLTDGIPTVATLQGVKGSRVVVPQQNSREYGPVPKRIRSLYRREPVPHPLMNLQKGEGKLEWGKALIAEAEETAREGGFGELRVVSGFRLRNITGGYTLPMAVQQYDLLFDSYAFR